jgi:formylglycine-generating enzyme
MIVRVTSLLACVAAAAAVAGPPASTSRAQIPGGPFESVLPPSPVVKTVAVAPFELDRRPITNGMFAQFVRQHPRWRRDQVVKLFADERYLQHWRTSTEVDAAYENQPVTFVSWFAASAYCEAQGARLPRWYEWEFAAAASETRADARDDAAWRQQILDWYSKSASAGLPEVGQRPANLYGVQDLHGVVWEWVEDLSSMLVSNDNREQGDPDVKKFCGAGAISMEQKENYAMLMRIAMLSSMQARYTSATMGFRCASDAEVKPTAVTTSR